MNSMLKYAALAVFVGASGAAYADPVETKGGITVKTEDGRFEAKVGGRIHLDSNIWTDDEDFGDLSTGVFFRRARLSLEGKAYGWTYKFENDFAGQSGTQGSGFRELWIGTKVAGANLRIGQAKPYRSMEELTSSNEILFMERPFSSASGIYRQFQTGLFLDGSGSNWGWGVSAYNLRAGEATADDTDGMGFTGRLHYAPVMTDKSVFHIGGTAGIDNPANQKTVGASVRYAGRRGPSQSLSANSTDEQTSFGLELAGKAGAFYAQGEYHMATFAEANAGQDVDVNTYYIQASYLLTGESKPYDVKKGVFKSPKPNGSNGAWELKVRYDFIDNADASTEREISQLSAGVNWYVNPNVRLMVEYVQGDNEPTGGTDVSGSLISTRAQFSF